jgi:hypothetical protein
MASALCRAIDFQERILQCGAFAVDAPTYIVGESDEIEPNEAACLVCLDDAL